MTSLANRQQLLSGNNMALIVEGYIKVPFEELETIKTHLTEHIKNTLNEDGCLEFGIKQDDIDKCVFHVFEKFIDSDAFNAHQARVKASDWGVITKNVERVYERCRQ
jgi:(4S)-4-hydroxy-5-phosphonooxypentane-2,3-dione isomerase